MLLRSSSSLQVLAARFDGLMEKLISKSKMDLYFGWMKGVLLNVGPDRIQLWMQFNMVSEGYSDEQMLTDDGKGLATDVTNVNETQWRIFNAIRELIDLTDKINTFEGVIVRIAEFNEVLDDMNANAEEMSTDGAEGKLGFENVDLLTPTGECLAKDASAQAIRGCLGCASDW